MKNARRLLLILLAACLLPLSAVAEGNEKYRISKKNAVPFGRLFLALQDAYESQTEKRLAAIDKALERIRRINADDYDVALSIADHWRAVFLDPDYTLLMHHGEEKAEEFEAAGLICAAKHAIIVLGYQLKDGEMQPELEQRCEAAAALARSLPEAILVCTGGATGSNNPEKHTEAGMMKDYLSDVCGITPDRIFIDELARTTKENAEYSLAILREQGSETMTIVTSDYHQRRGQMLYNAMAAMYGKRYGYQPRIVGNYCCHPENSEGKHSGEYQTGLGQLVSLLDLPRETKDAMKKDP